MVYAEHFKKFNGIWGQFQILCGTDKRERASSKAGFFVCHTLPIGIVAVRPDFLFVTPYPFWDCSSEAGFFVSHTLRIGIVAVRPDFLFVTPYLLGLYCSCEAEWFVRHTLPIVIVALMSDFLFVTPYPLGL